MQLLSLFALFSCILCGDGFARFLHVSSCSTKFHALKYGGVQHAGILVSDASKSKDFYIDVFGCTDDTHLRPTSLEYPGAFMRFGKDQIHLMELPSMDPKEGRPEHGGRDRHVAFTVNDLDVLKERLEKNKVFFTMSRGGRRALFCRDPDGNAFEFMEDKSI